MKLSHFKSALQLMSPQSNPSFIQLSGIPVEAHYHITEIGLVLKNYVDCGGVVRQERKATMQIWLANDTDHRLRAQKLLDINLQPNKPPAWHQIIAGFLQRNCQKT